MQKVKIAENLIVKSAEHRNLLLSQGYFVADFVPTDVCDSLLDFFSANHQLNAPDGGSFWSIYSQDEEYKKKTYQFAEDLLKIYKDNFLHHYKTLINAFVAKAPGIKSAFDIHQDTTAMDETNFSPLSIWLPLTDVTPTNGCMYLIPGTHNYTSYFRGVSIPSSFRDVTSQARAYGVPISLTKGQALFFDNRVLHFSKPNVSDQTRVALVCGVMEQQANYINCYKNQADEIELYEQSDEFILTNPYFLKDNHKRFCEGTLVAKHKWLDTVFTETDWNEITLQENLIRQTENYSLPNANAFHEPKPL